uniref:Armadillo repeat-containing protein 6-like n=2 Tax=Hirondellea gigas TaxID=1518452 RepID=A0A6A7FR70_9CRUS
MSLPKVISQDTYDEVVLENVTDFDKTLAEAIDETVQEFEAQGVLLSNIIKNVSLSDNQDAIVHPILNALEELRLVNSSSDSPALEQVSAPITTFRKECELSLCHRVMAAKKGAYDVLIRLINKSRNNVEVLCPLLQSMVALTDGNPDILTVEGMQVMQELAESYKSNYSCDAMEYLARWCLLSNLKHEVNRQALFAIQLPHSLVGSLHQVDPVQHKTRVLTTLKAIKSFTLDDDIRTEFGKAHDNCRHVVEEEKLIKVSLDIIKASVKSGSGLVAGEALSTLSSVCVRAEYCRQATDLGALDVINSILLNFLDSAVLTKQSMALIATLAGDDNVKYQVMKSATPFLITKAFDKHQLNVGVCGACCTAISMLVLRQPKNGAAMLECGAAASMLQAMKQHPKQKQLQKMGCLGVRNICCRSSENAALLRELQADDVVLTALKTHGADIKDMANGALRDLGVDVTLVEQWHGTGHELEQGD